MSQTTRKTTPAWVLAGIAFAAVALFGTAIALGAQGVPDAAKVKPALLPPELPPEWRWRAREQSFDHMFRQLRDSEIQVRDRSRERAQSGAQLDRELERVLVSR